MGILPAAPMPQLVSDPSWPSLQGSLIQALLSVIVLPRLNSITGLLWACKEGWVFPAVISTEGMQVETDPLAVAFLPGASRAKGNQTFSSDAGEFGADKEGDMGREEKPTHPCLINGVVELGFHGDLAVGVGVHQGQAEVGVIATSGDNKEQRGYFSPTRRHLTIPKASSWCHFLSTRTSTEDWEGVCKQPRVGERSHE